MRLKVLLGLLFAGAALLGIGRIGGGKGVPQLPSSAASQGQAWQSSEDATPIQEGVMNDRQKQHSHLLSRSRNATLGKTVRQLVQERGDVQVGSFIGNVRLPESFDLEQYLRKLSCDADLVVVGAVRDKSSNLTEDGSFIFTEYNLSPETVLKDNPAQHAEPNGTITVVRTGGKVKFLGHVVNAVDSSEKVLAVGGRYLLFLKFMPTTGCYKSLSTVVSDSTFKITGDQITQVSDQHFPFGSDGGRDYVSFMDAVIRLTKNPCVN